MARAEEGAPDWEAEQAIHLGLPPSTSSALWASDTQHSDIVQMVLEIFPEARWTTREEYRRLARVRDHQARRRRA